MKKFFKRVAEVAKATVTFVKEAVTVAYAKVKAFAIGVYQHFETIVILVLAVFGLANLIGELPFLFSLPMWVESTMFAPVAAVLIIKGLLKLSEWRINRRERKAAAAAQTNFAMAMA